MKPSRKHLIISPCIFFAGLISLSSFTLTSIAGQDFVYHKEIGAACSESTVPAEVYKLMPGVYDSFPKGPCPLLNSKGKEKFGGCKALSGEGVVWYYDMPEFQGVNDKAEVKAGCAEWIPVDS